MGVKHGDVVVSIVVVSPWFSGESHASERTELSGDVGFEVDVKKDQLFRDGKSFHLESFKDY